MGGDSILFILIIKNWLNILIENDRLMFSLKKPPYDFRSGDEFKSYGSSVLTSSEHVFVDFRLVSAEGTGITITKTALA